MSIIPLKAAPLPEAIAYGHLDPYDGVDPHGTNPLPPHLRWAGVFNTATAKHWEASNPDSTERVWLTPSGRWVLTSRTYGDCVITTEYARTWLHECGHSDAVAEHIDVARPSRGRPPIGPEVKTRLPEEFITALDAHAKELGVDRSELIRQIVMDAAPFGVDTGR